MCSFPFITVLDDQQFNKCFIPNKVKVNSIMCSCVPLDFSNQPFFVCSLISSLPFDLMFGIILEKLTPLCSHEKETNNSAALHIKDE